MSYVELQVTSHFSFLRGASSAQELFATAALMGMRALAVTDRNSLAGIVRAHEAAKDTGVRLIVGCRLDLRCGMSVLVYPTDRAGLWPALPAAVPRQGAGGKGEVPPGLGRCGGPRRGPVWRCWSPTRPMTTVRCACAGCATSSAIAPIWR